MKVITFLGAADARDVTYVHSDGRTVTAQYFGVALAHLYPGTQACIFVTPEAKQKHLAAFLEQVAGKVESAHGVDIPGGRTDAELWDIFDSVVAQVDPHETVLFDITHGFRSLPFLSFLAAAYLRTVKQITLHAVLYGNYEAGDRTVFPVRAPIIDLTSFVSLLDWMVAADRFVRFGDAGDLAQRLRDEAPNHAAQQQNLALRDVAKRMKLTAGALENASLALQLIRPLEAIEASCTIESHLVRAAADIDRHAQPFQPLAQQVVSAFGPIALSKAEIDQDLIATLNTERNLIQWYFDRKQYVQAMAVAREWLISWALLWAGFTDELDKEDREEVEQILGHALQQRMKQSGAFEDAQFSTGKNLRALPQIGAAIDLYGRLGETRNDLLHAGKRRVSAKAKDLPGQIKQQVDALFKLPLPASQSTSR